MANAYEMSQLSIEERDTKAHSRMTEEAARPGPSKRLRGAADDQPLNAGLHASQLCDNRLSGIEALHQRVNIETLNLLEKDAKELDEQGYHNDAEMMRSAARRLREEINLVQAGDAPPAQKPAAVWQSPYDVQHQDSSYNEYVGLLQLEAQRKAAPISMDRLTTKQWLEMQRAAALAVAIAEEPLVTEDTFSFSYFWGNSNKHVDYDSLIRHLNKIIPRENTETEWVNAARDYPELLSNHTLGYNISATIGVLAADRSAVQAGSLENGMRLLMDINETITASSVDQAQARLLLGNLRFRKSRPVLMLTDVCEEWHAMWLDGSTIYQHTFASRDRAVGFMEALLAGLFDRELPQTSFAKRRQMDDRLHARCIRDKIFAEQIEYLSRQSPTLRSDS